LALNKVIYNSKSSLHISLCYLIHSQIPFTDLKFGHTGVEVDKKLLPATFCRQHGRQQSTATFCRRRQKVDGNFLSTLTSTPVWTRFYRAFTAKTS